MSEWQPQVVRITSIAKHPNADTLDVIHSDTIGDYPVVAKSGQYKPGDLACYIPVDTVVPDTESFSFLIPKHGEKYTDEAGQPQVRYTTPKYAVGSVPLSPRTIKAKRLRGLFSMGMLVPPIPDLKEGDSIVEVLGLKKREEIEEDNIEDGSLGGAKKVRGANAAKPPIGWSIPYYDVEGARKNLACLVEGEEVQISEKLHGCNASFCWDGTQLWVKSRNFYKRENEGDQWWEAAKRYNLVERLKKFEGLVFFAELVGKVTGFRYDADVENGTLMRTKLHFFDCYDPKRGRYLDFDEFVKITDAIELSRPPELYRGPWIGKDHAYPLAEGQSLLNPKHLREGFVLRTVKERFEPKLGGRMQLKLIGEAYHLAKN